jgi:hypothetical protein
MAWNPHDGTALTPQSESSQAEIALKIPSSTRTNGKVFTALETRCGEIQRGSFEVILTKAFELLELHFEPPPWFQKVWFGTCIPPSSSTLGFPSPLSILYDPKGLTFISQERCLQPTEHREVITNLSTGFKSPPVFAFNTLPGEETPARSARIATNWHENSWIP